MKEVKNLGKIGCLLLGLGMVIGMVYFLLEYSTWYKECDTATFSYYLPSENTPEILGLQWAQLPDRQDWDVKYREFDDFVKIRYKTIVFYPDGKILRGIGKTVDDRIIVLEDKILPDRPWVIDFLRQEGNKLVTYTKPQPFLILAKAFGVGIVSYLIMAVIVVIGIYGYRYFSRFHCRQNRVTL